jgi:hypothetical protein
MYINRRIDPYSGLGLEGLIENEHHGRRHRETRQSLIISTHSGTRLCGHGHLDQPLKHSIHTKVVKATSISRQLHQPVYVIYQRRVSLCDKLSCINKVHLGGRGTSTLQSLQVL